MDYRQELKDKKKIVIKIGTSTITYPETGNINLDKLEKFVRILINLRIREKKSSWCRRVPWALEEMYWAFLNGQRRRRSARPARR